MLSKVCILLSFQIHGTTLISRCRRRIWRRLHECMSWCLSQLRGWRFYASWKQERLPNMFVPPDIIPGTPQSHPRHSYLAPFGRTSLSGSSCGAYGGLNSIGCPFSIWIPIRTRYSVVSQCLATTPESRVSLWTIPSFIQIPRLQWSSGSSPGKWQVNFERSPAFLPKFKIYDIMMLEHWRMEHVESRRNSLLHDTMHFIFFILQRDSYTVV